MTPAHLLFFSRMKSDEDLSLRHYYAEFFRRWFRLCVHAWKAEVFGNVALTVITVALTHKENGAWHTAWVSLIANMIWFACFAAIHFVRTPWLLQREGLPSENLRKSSALAELPVYSHDLRFDLLGICHGTTLDIHNPVLFLKASIVSDSKTALKAMKVTIAIDDKKYGGQPMSDLSGWILRTPTTTNKYPYKNFDDENLQTRSLWRKVQENGLEAGIPKEDWLGIQVPDATLLMLDRVSKIKVEIASIQQRESYRFHFSELPKAAETVFDAEFVTH